MLEPANTIVAGSFNLPAGQGGDQLRPAAYKLPGKSGDFPRLVTPVIPSAMNDALPTYAERLNALHQALADDFRQIIGRLPWQGHESIVDAGCGDGFFTGLLAEFRKQLDAIRPGLLLSIAAPAGVDKIRMIEPDKFHPYVDFINVMTYDFHGGWEGTTGFHSPLYANSSDPATGDVKSYNTDAALQAFLGQLFKLPLRLGAKSVLMIPGDLDAARMGHAMPELEKPGQPFTRGVAGDQREFVLQLLDDRRKLLGMLRQGN